MALKKIRPSMGRCVVKPMEEDKVSEGGIILVTSRNESSHVGTVVQACEPYQSALDDEDDMPSGPRYPVGTVVIYGKWTGTTITIDRQQFIVMNESDVLATLAEGTTL